MDYMLFLVTVLTGCNVVLTGFCLIMIDNVKELVVRMWDEVVRGGDR